MKLRQILATYKLEVVSFLVGAVILTFELTASRISAPYIGTTIYIWTSVIGSVLAGLAGGYAYGGWIADKHHKTSDIVLLLTVAALLLVSIDLIKDLVLGFVSAQTWPLRIQAFLTSVILFVPPTFVLGAIPPYLARLSLSKLSSSGQHIGRITAAGTVGSLFGTFLTGYVLFGYVGTSAIIGILAIALIVISVFVEHHEFLLLRVFVALVALTVTAHPPGLHIYNVSVVKEVETRYSDYVVGDTIDNNQPVRVLQPDVYNWESGIYLNGNRNLVFPYTQAFADIAKQYPDKHRILMIGGGTFTVPSYLANLNPKNKVDVVEIDSQLVSISKEYFELKQPKNMRIISADGRQFLNHNTSQYDLIYMDAFSGGVPPFQLLTLQATDRVKDSLASNGVVSVNIVAPSKGPGSEIAASVMDTYAHVFSHVAVFNVQPGLAPTERQNLLLLASDSPLPSMNQTQIQINSGLQNVLKSPVVFTDSGIVLTDNYAPVERLMTSY